MASLNKVILIGRLGKDPEVTSFENGNKKISVTMATSERYRDRDQNWVEQTDWHNIVVWGNLANDIAEGRRNYSKGDMMYVEGKLRTRSWADPQGVKKYTTEVVADNIQLLGKRSDNPADNQEGFAQQRTQGYTPPQGGYSQSGAYGAPSQQGYNQPAGFQPRQPVPPAQPTPVQQPPVQSAPLDIMGEDGADDLPF